ncbi:type I glyceraldehyde-3-phosphate dehydrogenase [Pseudoprimorskyibacter insulae]|uniref:Glyceraldehyde-3-phosphate dehydrogenase 1 n=1 Tax=Pseudoprimorskyibacter insulae TaxID=1695997 RepID=A0A2R8AR41_9RHOB|nr:glyceraldehyde 3-phosphate dehydrogenase NAD-binding domain-containing protein [Pseudoprimorskyibacter insulae]SPF78347.1 Glyceraldehyde-3-phosphate dehydrogenase 1 [Pseudoprimorskyibacter insulae]
MRIAINGFGRIGRSVLRQLMTTRKDTPLQVVAINDIAPLDALAYLLRYDSVFGPYPGQIDTDGDTLVVDGHRIKVTQTADQGELDLTGIDLLMECTGKVKSREDVSRGLEAGAGKVLVSGPCEGDVPTVVLGANEDIMGNARVISNASCTTNAMAPLLAVIDRTVGIETGHMTTVHCYTNSQPMVDGPRGDFARSRAGAVSMVPTTTSATKLVDRVLPQLAGRLSGAAIRVPTPSVSCVDMVLQTRRDLPSDAVRWLRDLAQDSPVLGVTDDPVVSADMRMRPESLVIALPETQCVGTRQIRIFGWYDNEWGFSARMIDMALRMGGKA